MSTSFPRTLRAIRADRPSGHLLLLAAVALIICVWAYWFVSARVSIWQVSDQGRIEVTGAVHPLQAPEDGSVRRSTIELGRSVRAGEVLVELDARSEELQRAEAAARHAACAAQAQLLKRELSDLTRAQSDELDVARAALTSGRAQEAELGAKLRLAQEEATRLGALRERGHVAEMALVRAQSDVERLRAAALAGSSDVLRLDAERRAKGSEQRTITDRLQRELASVEGEGRTLEATMQRLDAAIERRRIRAPIAGRIDEVTALHAGSVVATGSRLAVIVPEGELRIVARFPAETSVGRVRAGQRAQVRLAGFAWLEYGALPARVARVGTEVAGGGVRIELQPEPEAVPRIPLQHGLIGAVEAEVDRASPLALVLRGLGKRLAPASKSPQGQERL